MSGGWQLRFYFCQICAVAIFNYRCLPLSESPLKSRANESLCFSIYRIPFKENSSWVNTYKKCQRCRYVCYKDIKNSKIKISSDTKRLLTCRQTRAIKLICDGNFSSFICHVGIIPRWILKKTTVRRGSLLAQGPRCHWSCSQRMELTSDRRVLWLSSDISQDWRREAGGREDICLCVDCFYLGPSWVIESIHPLQAPTGRCTRRGTGSATRSSPSKRWNSPSPRTGSPCPSSERSPFSNSSGNQTTLILSGKKFLQVANLHKTHISSSCLFSCLNKSLWCLSLTQEWMNSKQR